MAGKVSLSDVASYYVGNVAIAKIYKGTKIGPDGMPMKVGYKTQEAFQEAVANFNQKFFA